MHAHLDAISSEPLLMVVPWSDPVVDDIGHDVRSQYVELFWLNVLGPTATWLLRRIALGFDRYPGGYELDLAETASALGLSFTAGTNSPFLRSLQRCMMFGVAQPIVGGLAVRRRVPRVAARHLMRMPPHLRAAHDDWRRSGAVISTNDVDRGRILAAAMVAVGDDADVIERQLLALGVSPLVAVAALASCGGDESGERTNDADAA
jgi:hypothetical protein